MKGAVAAGHPKTAEAAIRLYELGGNAFDDVDDVPAVLRRADGIAGLRTVEAQRGDAVLLLAQDERHARFGLGGRIGSRVGVRHRILRLGVEGVAVQLDHDVGTPPSSTIAGHRPQPITRGEIT